MFELAQEKSNSSDGSDLAHSDRDVTHASDLAVSLPSTVGEELLNQSARFSAMQQVQLKINGSERVLQLQEQVERVEGRSQERPSNQTGLPEFLRAGLENLSHMDLSDVRVHYNSNKPAQLNALAYAQNKEIHLGPGQENHLPHEGWHVVQQMQGRVIPNAAINGVAINDDSMLENEADTMGAKALQVKQNNQVVTKSIRPEATTHAESFFSARAGSSIAMQFARIGRAKHTPNVTGYPTLEGEENLGEGEIPVSKKCVEKAKAIVEALEREKDPLKQKKDGSLAGYMIGVAQLEDKTFVGAFSGSVPALARKAMTDAGVGKVFRANVPPAKSNELIQNAKETEDSSVQGRLKVKSGKEIGGIAGFCAAFKILYATTGQKVIGMAEVVFAPTQRPNPVVTNTLGESVVYEHGDLVPSCVTCRQAFIAFKAIAENASKENIRIKLDAKHFIQRNLAGAAIALDDLKEVKVPKKLKLNLPEVIDSLLELSKQLRQFSGEPSSEISMMFEDETLIKAIADFREAITEIASNARDKLGHQSEWTRAFSNLKRTGGILRAALDAFYEDEGLEAGDAAEGGEVAQQTLIEKYPAAAAGLPEWAQQLPAKDDLGDMDFNEHSGLMIFSNHGDQVWTAKEKDTKLSVF